MYIHFQHCRHQARRASLQSTRQLSRQYGFVQAKFSPNRILEDSVVGGVTLNHLAWAALLGGT